jgi:hypothetical protein
MLKTIRVLRSGVEAEIGSGAWEAIKIQTI